MQIPTPRGSLLARFLAIMFLLETSLCFNVLASQTGKQKVAIIANDVTLENVFKQIEKQTGLRFMYALETLNVNEKVSVRFKNITLDEVLTVLLGRRGIVWQYREGTISLKQQVVILREGIAIESSSVSTPTVTVSGKVIDAKDNPVPGATVMVKGTTKGTKTDGDGVFVLSGLPENPVLLVRSIGFETKEIVAYGLYVTIKMNEVVGSLGETVVVGYGTTTQRFNVGDVTIIKGEDIMKQPVTDPLLALQGRVPGMMITQTTGVQGGEVKVQIRGQNSLNNGTQPLFIIDGIPYSPAVSGINGFGAMGTTISALNFINPADIESINVLKDADATAIYGSRGANGVVLIITKKGKSGAARININVYSGWANVTRKDKLLNTSQYLEMRREAFKNDEKVPTASNAPDLLVWDTTRYTDWQKVLVGGTARYNDAQVSTSGGTNFVQYLVGGNYHKQTTVFPGNFSNQNGGAHFSITGISPSQRLRTVLTGSYAVSKSNVPTSDYANKINLEPDAPPIYNTDGTLNWANSTWSNPLANALKILDARTNNLLSNFDVSYRLFSGLQLKANLGYNALGINTFSGNPIASSDPKFVNLITASGTYTDTKIRSWIFEPQATYIAPIGKGTINALVGMTLLGNRSEAQRLIALGIKDDALIRNLAAATSYISSNTGSNYKYAAVFARVGYNLEDKYLLNLTLRRDGSSRFGPRKQFATFGSIGAGWIFSEEKLIKTLLPFLRYGKLRASYGTVGNDQIGDYGYLDRYEYQDQTYQQVKGLRQVGLFNADFAWELTRKAEAGLETGFLENNKILLVGSYYRNRSTNQLISYPLPTMVGASSINGNLPAVIQNSGWEFALTTRNIQKRNFEWSTSFNISVGRNKLVSYSGSGDIYARVGQSLSQVQLFKFLGVDPAKGSYLFADAKGNPVPAEIAIQYTSLNLEPTYFGGIQNSLRFKGFNLDVFFQYVKQMGASGLYDALYTPGSRRNQSVTVLNRWQQAGDNTDVQRFSQNGSLTQSFKSTLSSDKGYADASFIRCKNVSLSWQVPESWKQKMHVNNCRIYFQGQNLFTITKYPGWDPETKSVSVIPPLRVLTGGIQLIL